MKRFLKGALAIVICAAMVLGTVCLEGIDFPSLKASAAIGYTSNFVEFGSYPQSLVDDESLISTLNGRSKNWKSYDYYSGNGNYGSMSSGNYMKYADVTYNGNKYRAVTFSQYRPNTSCGISNDVNSYQDQNGYYPGEVYWFRYEPIEWYIADADKGIIVTSELLDAQPYSNFVYWADSNANGIKDKDEVFNNSSCTTYANDYASSSIREWLNEDFYNTAFNSEEQKELKAITINNDASDEEHPEYSSEATRDKVFLLSDLDFSETGFFSLSDTGSSYARCQGLFVGNTQGVNGKSHWWLRTAGNTSYTASNVHATHTLLSDGVSVDNTYMGVRPAIKVELICLIPDPLPAPGKIKVATGDSWSDNCNYYYNYTDEFFNNPSTEYNHSFALMSLVLACSAFVPNGGWKETADNVWIQTGDDYRYKYAANAATLFSEIGFDLVKSTIKTEFGTVERAGCFYGYNKKPGYNTIACSIGAKNIDETDTTIIACAVRGSGYESEWGGNFIMGKGSDDHYGFTQAKRQVLENLELFVFANEYLFNSNVIIWITGYSRAAATSNLVAAALNNGAPGYSDLAALGLSKEKVYCYGFETPQGTTSSSASSSRYNNIFSIVNPIDLVPYLAPSNKGFNFKRYGTTYYLPAMNTTSWLYTYTSDSEKQSVFSEFSGTFSSLYSYMEYSEDFVATSFVFDKDKGYVEKHPEIGQVDFLVDFLRYFSQKILKNRNHYCNNYQDTFRDLMAIFMGGNHEASLDANNLSESILALFSSAFHQKPIFLTIVDLIFSFIAIPILGPLLVAINDIFDTAFFTDGGDIISTLIYNFVHETNDVAVLFYPHSNSVTIAWMVYLDELADYEVKYLLKDKCKTREYTINCPVDVYVYDEKGNLAGSIIDDKVEYFSNISIYIDSNGQKCFSLPFDSEYKIKIVATDSGEVNCSIKELDIASLNYERIINHYDISVESGDVIEGIAECSDGSIECLYPLTLNGSEPLVPDEELVGEEVIDYLVNVSNNLDIVGLTNGGGVMTKGEFAQATAFETEGVKFLGWYNGETLLSTDPVYRFAVEGDIDIVGMFELTDYTAKFVADGNLVSSVYYNIRTESITEPSVPVKEGYSGSWEEYTLSTGDITINAVYTKNSYKVTWINKENTTEETYMFGDEIIVPDIDSKEHYIAGWLPQVPDVMPAEDLTFTATWSPITCEAVFDANGGSWSNGETVKTFAVDYDSQIFTPETPEKQGYIFAGWLIDGENIGSDAGIMNSPDGKLFKAQWIASDETYYTVETYTMTPYGEYLKSVKLLQGTTDESVSFIPEIGTGFVLNEEKSSLNGSVSADNSLVLKAYIDRQSFTFTTTIDGESSSLDYYFGAMIAQPKTPLKPGYNFKQWSQEIPETMPAENIEITAEFETIEYMAIFIADGNEVASVPYTVESESVELPDVPDKKGFDGVWESFSFEIGGVNVNAVYTPKTYKITWKIDFITLETELKYGQQIVAPDIPEKQGYVFSGWNGDIPETMPDTDLAFTAIYEKVNSDKFICSECGSEFNSSDALNAHISQHAKPADVYLTIKEPSTNTINYGETLVMHANSKNLPEGAKIVWEVSGNGIEYEPSSDGKTCRVTSVANGEATVTVKAVDSNGNVIVNSDGTKVSYSQKITSKAGIWQRIVSFFKNLFGINRTIAQAFFK